MAKRMQEQKGDERSVAKSISTATNLSSHVPTSSSSAKSPNASKSPGNWWLRWNLNAGGEEIRNPTGKPGATKEESGGVDLSESETWSYQELAAYKTATWKPNASSISDHPVSPKAERKEWSHNLHVSPATIHQKEAVFSIVWRIYGREHDDPMDDLDVSMAIWDIFLNTTLRAAVHLGQDHEAYLRNVTNNLWNSVGQLFRKTGKLISQHNESLVLVLLISKILRGFRQAYCVNRLFRSPTPKRLRLLRPCALCGKNGRRSCCNLEEQNWMVLGKQSLQGYESNGWYADGVRVENIHRNHNVGPPREDSKSSERPTVWTWALHRQDHLHVDVLRHWMGSKRKSRKMWIQFTDSCGICS